MVYVSQYVGRILTLEKILIIESVTIIQNSSYPDRVDIFSKHVGPRTNKNEIIASEVS
jgi:hypothetical protein